MICCIRTSPKSFELSSSLKGTRNEFISLFEEKIDSESLAETHDV